MKVWYRWHFFWRRGDADGDDSPQDRDDGTGDLIWNTLTRIVFDRDTSEWAILSFMECGQLLRDRIRWPDEFNIGNEGPNRWIWYPYKWIIDFLKWLGINVRLRWSRPQSDMTRDPYKAFGSCYAHLYKSNGGIHDDLLKIIFDSMKIPRYVNRRHTWTWWRRFKNDGRPHYVKRMTYFEARGIVDWFEKNYEDQFYKDTP